MFRGASIDCLPRAGSSILIGALRGITVCDVARRERRIPPGRKSAGLPLRRIAVNTATQAMVSHPPLRHSISGRGEPALIFSPNGLTFVGC
jgi:hypothetical protein